MHLSIRNLKYFKYNSCVTITGASFSKERLYQELGLESLQFRRWYRKPCSFYKIYKNNWPSHVSNIILQENTACNIRNVDKVNLLKIGLNFLKNSFFPSTVIEWNKLDPNLRYENSFHIFRKIIFQFIRPSIFKQFYNCHDPKGLRLVSRLWTGLSYLRDYITCIDYISSSTVLFFKMKGTSS